MEQRNRYDDALVRALAIIGSQPHIGRLRDDVSPDCRAYLVERHVIYYVPQPAVLLILRILHGRADVRHAF